jgi:CDP-glucose 4,6-dehydratase
MESDLQPKILNEASNEIEAQYLSSKKANELLNWNSKYTLEEGLKKTVKWYKEFF